MLKTEHEVPQEFKGGRHQLCLGCRGSFTEEGLLELRQEGGAGGAMEQSLPTFVWHTFVLGQNQDGLHPVLS